VNEGNYAKWDDGMKRYIDYLKQEDTATERPYSLRYIGTMVGDFHRTLLYGGIFCYPGDKKNPEGKLRLMYEGNPMSMLVEHAGGKGSTGFQRVLEVKPKALHQRIPMFIGSEEDVKMCEAFLQGLR